MTGGNAEQAEKHAAQLRTVQRTLERMSSVVVRCRSKVKQLQEEVDDLLYQEHSQGHERVGPENAINALPGPRCTSERHERAPAATHLVWKTRSGEPSPRCYECARDIVRTQHEEGKSAHASPILAGPPCQGHACRSGRRRHATMRIITKEKQHGTAYCQSCGARAQSVLEEQETSYETAPAALRPAPRDEAEEGRPKPDVDG